MLISIPLILLKYSTQIPPLHLKELEAKVNRLSYLIDNQHDKNQVWEYSILDELKLQKLTTKTLFNLD